MYDVNVCGSASSQSVNVSPLGKGALRYIRSEPKHKNYSVILLSYGSRRIIQVDAAHWCFT